MQVSRVPDTEWAFSLFGCRPAKMAKHATIGTRAFWRQQLSTSLLIHRTETLAVEAFKRPKDIRGLKRNLVAFSGTPRKHPDDPFRIVLFCQLIDSRTL